MSIRDYFEPTYFAHGRVLYRYPGSDSARFSPRLAWRLIRTIHDRYPSGGVLWDPFCGSGLIPALAALFFPGLFRTIVASDSNPTAVACAARNLAIATSVDAMRQRRDALARRRRQNVKSDHRWGAVVDYIDAVLPLMVSPAVAPLTIHTFSASAFALQRAPIPIATQDTIHFVTDLPYGRQSRLVNGCLDDLASMVLGMGDRVSLTVVLPSADVSRFIVGCAAGRIWQTPCRGQRTIVFAESPMLASSATI